MGIAIQVHPDEYDVRLFIRDEGLGAFAVLRAYEGDSTVSLFMSSPADCDELIKAAAEAKRLLLGDVIAGDFGPETVNGGAK